MSFSLSQIPSKLKTVVPECYSERATVQDQDVAGLEVAMSHGGHKAVQIPQCTSKLSNKKHVRC